MSKLLQQPGAPRYVKIAEELRTRIADGVLRPGDRLPSFHQMRLELGIHQPILDRAYRLLEEDGLLERRPNIGTFVTEPDETSSRTGLIGFSGLHQTRGMSEPYWHNLVDGMRSVLTPQGLHLVLLPHDTAQGFDKVDGAIIAAMSPDKPLSHLPPDCPCVAVLQPLGDFVCVRADDVGGGREAAELLLALGHTRIGTLGGGRLFEERCSGLDAALQRASIGPEAVTHRGLHMTQPRNAIGHGRDEMQHWLEDGFLETGCTALLVQNDGFAIGVMESLRQAGVSVPDQVSVVGFDSTEICEVSTPRLTSVRVPLFEIGASAARKVLRLLDGEDVEELEVLPTSIDDRQSTVEVLTAERQLVAA